MFLGATYGTEATSAPTPIGLWAQGVRPASHQTTSWAQGTASRAAPPPAGLGASAQSESAKVSPPPGVTPKPRDGEAQWIGVRPPPLPEGGMGIGLGRSHPSPLGGGEGVWVGEEGV